MAVKRKERGRESSYLIITKKMAKTGPGGVLTSCSGSDNFRNENKIIIINKNVHIEFERN